MDDGMLKLKRHAMGSFDDSVLDDDETTVASNKSCESWNNCEV